MDRLKKLAVTGCAVVRSYALTRPQPTHTTTSLHLWRLASRRCAGGRRCRCLCLWLPVCCALLCSALLCSAPLCTRALAWHPPWHPFLSAFGPLSQARQRPWGWAFLIGIAPSFIGRAGSKAAGSLSNRREACSGSTNASVMDAWCWSAGSEGETATGLRADLDLFKAFLAPCLGRGGAHRRIPRSLSIRPRRGVCHPVVPSCLDSRVASRFFSCSNAL